MCNGGIGKGIADALASAGSDIVIAARNEAKTTDAVKDIRDKFGVHVLGLKMDVNQEASVQEGVKKAINELGKITILVNNAGVNIRKMPRDYTVEERDWIMNTNLRSAFVCAKTVYPSMKKAGGAKVVEAYILAAPFGRWGAFAVVMFIIFLLGFFIDWIGIIFIMIPILSPIAPELGFDPLWFALMICVNLQMSFMTPPFAPAIFHLRGSAAPELGVTMGDIIWGVFSFVGLIMIGLGLCVVFPQLILWLPTQMIK